MMRGLLHALTKGDAAGSVAKKLRTPPTAIEQLKTYLV
jgi:hypothetical protein